MPTHLAVLSVFLASPRQKFIVNLACRVRHSTLFCFRYAHSLLTSFEATFTHAGELEARLFLLLLFLTLFIACSFFGILHRCRPTGIATLMIVSGQAAPQYKSLYHRNYVAE